MKSHEQKMAEKAAHEAQLERNDLNAWFTKNWDRLKSGDLISRRFAIFAVAVGAILGLAYYLLSGSLDKNVAAWKSLENTASLEGLDDFSKSDPESTPSKVARLQKARQLIGPRGLMLMNNNIDPAVRAKAVKSVEEARELFAKLADEFKGDLTMACQAIEGAAQAELALVGIPKESSATEMLGSVEKAIELYKRYEKIAGPAAGEPAKLIAEELEAKKNDVVKLGEFINKELTKKKPENPPVAPVIPPAGPTPPK